MDRQIGRLMRGFLELCRVKPEFPVGVIVMAGGSGGFYLNQALSCACSQQGIDEVLESC